MYRYSQIVQKPTVQFGFKPDWNALSAVVEWKEAGLGSHGSSTPLAPQVCVVSVLKTPLKQIKTQTCRSMTDALNMPSLASLTHNHPK